jgi:iron complex outermembrane recepter protein
MIRNHRGRAAAITLACGSAVVIPTVVNAETAVLEEVVVTAERRETALQDTPLSIIAMTAEGLEAKGVTDLMRLSDVSPNLSIKGGRTGGNNAPVFSVRGIGGGGGATGERGVGLYIDGIYVPRTSGSVFKVFDIERAEVLRGPQGTLFGRNSTGGAIRLFTKQPGSEFDAYVKGTFGNFNHTDVSAMVNLPINDKLVIRTQGAYLHEEGFIERGTQTLGGSEDYLGRLQIAYQFSDSVKLTVSGLYSDSKGDGSPQDIRSFDLQPVNVQGNYSDWLSDAYVLAGQAPLAVLNDPRIVLDNRTMPALCFIDDFDPDWDDVCTLKDDNRYWQADANLRWEINERLQFTSVTGFTNLNHDSLNDGPLLGFNITEDFVSSESIYQEFQLNAKMFDGKVDAVTGLNYFHEKSNSRGTNLQRRGTSTYSAAGGAPNGNSGGGIFLTRNPITDQESNSYGWFNSVTWHTTNKLNLTGGFRVAYDEKKIDIAKYPGVSPPGGAIDFTPVPGTTFTAVEASDDWQAIDWRGTIDYHFTNDLMAYMTVSKAYKAGAFSYTITNCTTPAAPGTATCLTGPQQSAQIKAIPPEKIINYEAGLRMTFFDGRWRFNPTYYYMKWTNRQTALRVNCPVGPDCPQGSNLVLSTAGDIDLSGVELDTQFAVTDNLVLDGGLGTTHAKIHNETANGGPNLFPPQASPTYNIGATYSFTGRMNDKSIGDFTYNLNYSYTDEQQTYPESTDPAANSDAAYLLDSYRIVNTRLQWVSPGKSSLITLFVNNVLDEDYATFGTKFGGGFWDTFNPGLGQLPAGVGAPLRNMVSVTAARPREYGVTFQYNFK